MVYIFIIFILSLLLGLTAIVFIQQKRKIKQLQTENNKLSSQGHELTNKINSLEFENTQFKLNPHLFKNTLNSIQSYAFRTYQSLEKLSWVLDYILYDSNVQLISLKQELEFARNFIELNKIKLNPLFDLRVTVKVNEEDTWSTQNLISPLVTAFFIENAFKHADLQSTNAFIAVNIELKENLFHYSVSNKINAKPLFQDKGGVGKETLKKRLDSIYGNNYMLEYVIQGETHHSTLKIDLLEFKAKMLDNR